MHPARVKPWRAATCPRPYPLGSPPPEGSVLEAWKGLVSEAHHEHAYPPEDHGVCVRVDRRQETQLQETPPKRDLKEVDCSPQAADGQYDRHAGFEKPPIDVVLQAFPVHIGLRGRTVQLSVDLPQ